MWKINELKKQGKLNFKKNIKTLILVGIFMTFFISEYVIGRAGIENIDVIEEAVNDSKMGIEISSLEESKDVILNKYVDEMISQLFTGNMNGIIKTYNEKHNVRKGVIFTAFNLITNGHSQFQNLINSIFSNQEINKFLIIFTASFAVILKIFFVNPIMIGANRIYLESISFSNTQINRIVFPFKEKRYFKVVKSLFLMQIYKTLWNFTIIGGIIKSYSYKMVPFIIAENPEISGKNAIIISRKMMNGNKRKSFLLDLSFIGLDILQYLTLGLFGIYVTPYYSMTYVELYSILRKEYIKEKKVKFELLNDNKLYKNTKVEEYEKKKIFKKISKEYDKTYSVSSIIIFFFIFSFVGWLWEEIYFILEKGVIVNRGVLYGPWLPIYGVGCSLIIALTQIDGIKKMLKNPLLTFNMIVIFCCIVEYCTSLYIEKTLGVRYWNYTGIFMNLNGRICLECAIFFGLGGSLCVYIIAPLLEKILLRRNNYYKVLICIILLVLFCTDMLFSQLYPRVGLGITDEIEVEK